jgi:translation initiation factor 2 alpha subunit (eIF-2alpha)
MSEEKMVNNYEFAKILDRFKREVLDPLDIEESNAFAIISNLNYKWASDDQRKLANAKFDKLSARNAFYKKMYKAGMDLTLEHERLTNSLCKWYGQWYDNISNNGRQESEMMEMQADMLNELFTEVYKAIEPLELDIKPPAALNLK